MDYCAKRIHRYVSHVMYTTEFTETLMPETARIKIANEDNEVST